MPSWRATKDVTIKADIIEEITRVYGYDNFKITTTKAALAPVMRTAGNNDDRWTKDLLVQRYGMHEVALLHLVRREEVQGPQHRD